LCLTTNAFTEEAVEALAAASEFVEWAKVRLKGRGHGGLNET